MAEHLLVPHCGLAPETARRRLWECPRWTEVRRQVLDGDSARTVRVALPDVSALIGLMPWDSELAEARALAERAVEWPGPL